jgi:hypothetical protein
MPQLSLGLIQSKAVYRVMGQAAKNGHGNTDGSHGQINVSLALGGQACSEAH